MTVNPRDFLLNTDYELDKIIYFKEGNFIGNTEFQHELSFTPLVFGVWSTDSNFSSVNTLGVADPSTEAGYTPFLGVECSADSSAIKLVASGENSGSTRIYYRVYAFEPTDSQADTPTTSNNANTFILNTDYNYCKLKATGEFTQSGQEYQHNLGYVPQVMAWVKTTPTYGSTIQPITFASNYTNFKIIVTTNKIRIENILSPFVEKVYWRLYYDQA